MNYVLNVLAIAGMFYILDLFWRHSKLYKSISSNKIINKKNTKIILALISVILIVICIFLEKIFSGYLLGEDKIKLLIKGSSLLVLYFVTSFIFNDNYTQKTDSTK